jgi:UPF0716 protein FxsA
MPLLFILFIIVPVIEIYLFIKVGGLIGALPTVGIVLLTAVVGAWMLRQQGLSTLGRVQSQLEAGALPAAEVLEGIVLLVGGALLLTPGFFTDVIGFLCLIPATRKAMLSRLVEWSKGRIQVVHTQFRQEGRSYEKGRTYEGRSWHERDDDRLP